MAIAVDPSCKEMQRIKYLKIIKPVSKRIAEQGKPLVPHLDRFDCILHLEQSSLRAKGIHTPIILAACEEHGLVPELLLVHENFKMGLLIKHL